MSRYMWINSLETGNNQVIYVPTEAGLPILEAGKRVANAHKGGKVIIRITKGAD